jgi:hypothetical protein
MLSTATTARDWTEFDPRAYLDEYYAEIGGENHALLQFLVDAYREVTGDGVLLDFGCGPTIYALIPAAPRVREIHLCDYLEVNLDEVRRWLRGEQGAFDWRPFVRATLEIERGERCSNADTLQREIDIRARVNRLTRCDLSLVMPLGPTSPTYDIVTTNFCAESITDRRWSWSLYLPRIVSLLKPGGAFLMSAVKGASGYSVGQRVFPTADIAEADISSALCAAGCDPDSISIKSVAADRSTRRYRGLMFARALKRLDRAAA